MSTLQQSINARRAAAPTELACVSTSAQVPAVLICIWGGDSWVLPWSYLLAGSLTAADGTESLALSFSGHAVTAHGYNLRGVLDDLAGFRIACLREFPAEYRDRVSVEAPFIVKIEVRAEKSDVTVPDQNS